LTVPAVVERKRDNGLCSERGCWNRQSDRRNCRRKEETPQALHSSAFRPAPKDMICPAGQVFAESRLGEARPPHGMASEGRGARLATYNARPELRLRELLPSGDGSSSLPPTNPDTSDGVFPVSQHYQAPGSASVAHLPSSVARSEKEHRMLRDSNRYPQLESRRTQALRTSDSTRNGR
jgi:hypothetical protein